VLALYLLTVLAPLHHARASQLVFADLGYVTLEASWLLCTPAGLGDPDRDALVAKCPATGIGKTDMDLPVLATLPIGRDPASLAASLFQASPAVQPRPVAPPGGPRAPPVLV
jgi:hypothetical protein